MGDEMERVPIRKALQELISRASSADFQSRVETAERQRAAETRRRHEELRAVKRRTTLERSGLALLPKDLEMVLAKALDESDPVKVVRGWLLGVHAGRHAPRTLVLSGPLGVGKTLAAAELIAWGADVLDHGPADLRALSADPWPHVATSPDELARAFEPHRRDGRDRYIVEARILVLDDLGTEQHGRFAGAFAEVVNRRLSDPRALTLINSNLGREVIERRYDERTIDRLRDPLIAAWAESRGESLRTRRGA